MLPYFFGDKPNLNRTMKKIIVACTFLSFIIGCSTNDVRGPEQVLASFADAIAVKDFPKAKTYCTPESRAIMGTMGIMGVKWEETLVKKFDSNKIEFGTATVTGDDAMVPVKLKTSGGIVNIPMKKISGEWKVSLNTESVMDIANEKIREKAGGFTDSIRTKAKDALNKIDVNAIKKKINTTLDSLKF